MPAIPKWHSADAGKLILRIGLASILLFHGIYKIGHGVAWIKPLLAHIHLPMALAYGTYIAEVVAPVLLILGFQVRLAALAVVVDMCMAIGLVLSHQIFSLKQEPGGGWAIELQALLLFSALALVFLGGGSYGLSRKPKQTNHRQSA
jgi:putative oxidoreductase